MRLGLTPVRSGSVFLFGMAMRRLGREVRQPAKELEPTSENVVLNIHGFRLMWHVTLRWDPVHSALRRTIEKELRIVLAATVIPEHELGPRLTLAGMTLFTACVTSVLGLILIHSLT